MRLRSLGLLGGALVLGFAACGDETNFTGHGGAGGGTSSTTGSTGGGGSGGTGGTSSSSSSSSSGTGGTGGMGTGGTGGTGGMGNPVPMGLGVVINDAEVDVGWTSPDPSSGNTKVKLIRTLNTPPTGPDDPTATLIYSGSASSAAHPTADLLPDMMDAPRTYHYAVYGCTSADVCETTGSAASLTPTLTECLRGGGYNLFWRHASATVCADNLALGSAATTMTPDWWKSCEADCAVATARQLNATGVMEATSIGQDLASLAIPFGKVISSEYCRTVQTAENMALGPAIETSQQITYFVYDEANRCADSYPLLAAAPPAGANVALISHAGFSCPVLDALAWGEAAIFKPDGQGSSTLITRVVWDQWTALP